MNIEYRICIFNILELNILELKQQLHDWANTPYGKVLITS